MSSLNTALLKMEGISKRFGSTIALDQVDFDLKKGEVHSLIGENGAGKSTLMKIISGALKPDSGRITLNGTPYRPESPIEARKQGIAMIYQELNLAPQLNAIENVMLGIERSRFGFLKRKDMKESVKQALTVLNHLEIPLDVPVYQLGVSSQQIIEIARALVMKAKIIIMDEPTSSLSGDDMETLFTIIRDLKEKGISIIYISHFLEEVMRVADRYSVLRDGQCVGTGPIQLSSVENLITQMLGRELNEIYSRIPFSPGAKILELDCLCGKKFPLEASLNLHRGEILGITGLVGAGRTEMLNAIFGLNPIRSGKVKVTGVSFTKVTPQKMVARGMGFLSENRKEEGLALTRSIADNIALSNYKPFARWGWINPEKQAKGVNTWIQKLDIVISGPDQRVNALPGRKHQPRWIGGLGHDAVDPTQWGVDFLIPGDPLGRSTCDAHHSHGDDEGNEPEGGDQKTVEETSHPSHCDSDQDGGERVGTRLCGERGDHAHKGDDRPDGKIDASTDDDHGHAQGSQGDDDRLGGDADEISEAKESFLHFGNQGKNRNDQHQSHERAQKIDQPGDFSKFHPFSLFPVR